MKRIAVFGSGNGTNFESLVKASKANYFPGEVVLLIYDKKEAFIKERAKKLGIKSFYFNLKDFIDKEAFEKAICQLLKKENIDLICLAGYMKIVGKTLLESFPERIINIHPALLPAFKGNNAIEEAFNYPVKITGVTVHFVNELVDGGKIIKQKAVEILEKDTLSSLEKKIHQVEHKIYKEAIKLILEENL